MTTEAHRAFRVLIEALNRHDADAAAALLAEDVVCREPASARARAGMIHPGLPRRR